MPATMGSAMMSSLLQMFLLSVVLELSTSQETPSDFGIFDWIHKSPGGYFNTKQEFRYEVPGDSSTLAGVFAKEKIAKDEILLEVPWDLVIEGDDEDCLGPMCCETVSALAREMRLGAQSKFGPYVQYLNALPDKQLPSGWSEEGKELLRIVVGIFRDNSKPSIPPQFPTEWLTDDWYYMCEADPSDTLSAKAAMFVVQRSAYYYIVPGFDMYNHRNGKWFNTISNTEDGKTHVVKASRDIQPGEQIYTSYNRCEECGARITSYGTAEILRDYGFIEQFPQDWYYFDGLIQMRLDKDPENGKLVLSWNPHAVKLHEFEHADIVAFFRRQILRLRRVRNLSKFDESIEKIPSDELEIIWEFLEANIVAMAMAMEAIEIAYFPGQLKEGVEPMCSSGIIDVNGTHYDPLSYEVDYLKYIVATCDNDLDLLFGDYKLLEQIESIYQKVHFAMDPEYRDVYMDIDGTVQICSSYRPQYHEYVVHAAGRFVDPIKRIIFIGGGDSMLLHEALKYPSLELVVGLELDQSIVRKSFQYFQTQPHFDDDRVEWWFGDATKSLLLLPEDYWGSFDLVLVDLSETVMALSVTDELDVFDALRLLLQPKGVMVKNELYMDKFSELFDYSTQIYYESPVVCSQVLAMGSNSADFFRQVPKDHGVETLLYESLHTPENHLDFLHDYRMNDARAQGQCGDLKISNKLSEQKTAAGIVTIVNAEKTSVPLEGTVIAEKIGDAIKAEGFTLVRPPIFENDSVYAVMNEGYIVARLWPDERYCAFDINLWGRFSKMKDLQAALVASVESQLVSTYKVVVGGMFGSSTWEEDTASIGPKIVRTRNCDDPETLSEEESASTEEMISAAIKKGIHLAESTKNWNALVFCGVKGESEECAAADLLRDRGDVTLLKQIWTCEGLGGDSEQENPPSSFEDMVACEAEILNELLGYGKKSKITKFDLLVVDTSAPLPMLQILHSILQFPRHRVAFIEESRNMLFAISDMAVDEPWRRNFLDRYRKIESDPLAWGEIHLQSGQNNAVVVGVVSVGDTNVAYHLETYEKEMQKTFESMKKDVRVQVRSITGGAFKYQDEWDPITFPHTAYDPKPALDQFKEQKFLGRQNIYQLVPSKGVNTLDMSSDKLKDILSQALVDEVHFNILSHYEFSGFGEGVVHVYTCKEGNIISVWDGRNHIDINLFTYEELSKESESFITAVLRLMKGQAMVGLHDDQPRGTGRVVNLQSDILSEKKTVLETSI